MNSLQTVATKKSYGLQKKKAKTTARAKIPLGFFDTEDDDEDESIGDVERVNREMVKQQMKNAEKIQPRLSSDEAKIYDYDGCYDEFKRDEAPKSRLSQAMQQDEPKSRYISKIQAVASVREKEKDRIYERRLLKERQQEDAEFGDMPKFVTSAYKQKLMEDQKWEYEDRLADAVEKNTTVESRGMHGFMSNLLTKNIAMGADVERSAVSAYTAGSSRQQKKLNEEEQDGEEKREVEQQEQEQARPVSGGGGKSSIDKRDTTAVSGNKRSHDDISQDISGNDKVAQNVSPSQEKDDDKKIISSSGPTASGKEVPDTKKASKEDAVKAARERFLARKNKAVP